MGRKKLPPDQQLRYVTVGLRPKDFAIVENYAKEMGVSLGYAVRVLINSGSRGPARSPFTPEEDS